jgi:hypothetical protein
MRRPTIKRSVASAYAGPHETIVEIWSSRLRAGCLFAVREADDGRLILEAYRGDAGVFLRTPTGDVRVTA